ncbi:DUF1648 domain-containing protein [Streptomyces sp. NPDC046862]|uniref:DUF1648 domain-containing protein n=1 Tax=Streptomyces sp. NPDC046862 TaxID=3154603 RepID=UPI00345542C4
MTRPSRSRILAPSLLGTAPFAFALLLELSVFAAHRERLPAEMASHFDLAGVPNGFMDTGRWVAVTAGITAMAAIGLLLPLLRGALPGKGHRGLLATGWGTAGLLGYLFCATISVNAGLTDPSAARFSMWHLLAGLGTAVAAAALGWSLAWLLLPPDARPQAGTAPGDTASQGERLDLRQGERAAWSRPSASRGFVVAVLAVAVAVPTLRYALDEGPSPWVGLPLAAGVGLAAVVLGVLRVTVDIRGLTVASLLVPAVRRRVKLEQVESAVRRDIRPLEYGGWGYRVRPRSTAVVLHGGQALVLRLVGGREFAVTVDDADTAAALLNTLVDQRRSPGR